MFKQALILSLSLLAAGAQAAGPANTSADYGRSTDGPAAKRIVLTPQTKAVNVNDGETVEFIIGDKSFSWHFQTFRNENNFELAKIAPPELGVNGVRVYISPDPVYRY